MSQRARFQFRREEGVGAHGAGDLAHADIFQSIFQPFQMAAEFGIETGHLEAEAGGLGMDAVRAAHAEHALVFVGQLFQAFHNNLTDLAARNFFLFPAENRCLDRVDRCLNICCRYRTFIARPEYSAFQLSTVILLTVVVLLDHDQRYGLHLLIGCKTLVARITGSSPSDRRSVICRS